ncbi:hypothetical protein [Amphibacillus jilinensis]|uniref:hypothetical protein n=1 Tax=Amphibacillus jilinensis TaxID=1216008 RepID=UPI00030DFE75|nr:hypothetical protein [Amphibacillus jilinensis]
MFIRETVKVFLKGPKIELLSLIVGLTFMLTLANIEMHHWSWLVSLGFMLLCTTIFRFITVDKKYYLNDQSKLTYKNVVDYVVSKNLFTILFVLLILSLVFVISSFFKGGQFEFQKIGNIIIYCLFVLGSDNIIYSFNNKPVPSYASGFKRNELEDIKVGWTNLKSQLPSFIMIGLYCVIFFVIDFVPDLFSSIVYYITGFCTLIYFMKLEKKKET